MKTNRLCPICRESEIKVVESVEPQIINTEAFKKKGASLDLRGFSNIIKSLHYCPHCHYIWQYDDDEHDMTKFLDISEKFLSWIHHRELPETVRVFMGYYVIASDRKAYKSAGVAALHAAWACDDLQLTEYSRTCRRLAADTLLMYLREGNCEYSAAYALQMIDSYRRVEEYHLAMDAIARVLDEELFDFKMKRRLASKLSGEKEEKINRYYIPDKCLVYQYSLCLMSDKKIHYFDEIPKDISKNFLELFFGME